MYEKAPAIDSFFNKAADFFLFQNKLIVELGPTYFPLSLIVYF